MRSDAVLITAAGLLAPAICAAHQYNNTPSVDVPACPQTVTVSYSKSVPDLTPFPKTDVALCYSDTSIEITFSAFEEKDFFFNASQTTNDPIWAYEVMEAFIAKGTADPTTYLEFEVNPNNVTFNAFIFNPSKVRSIAMDTAFLQTPIFDGLTTETVLDKENGWWVSAAKIPLGLFNVDNGTARDTDWRMNFFRTVTGPDTYPNQTLGAWSPPDKPSFHMTPFFGHVKFV